MLLIPLLVFLALSLVVGWIEGLLGLWSLGVAFLCILGVYWLVNDYP